VAAVIKRGENKQAVYLISNRASTIRRILNGTNFIEIGFLDNRNIYYVEMIDGRKVLSFTNERRRSGIEIAEGVDYVQKAPNGDAILYSKGKDLYLFRVNGKESINLSNNFNRENYPPIFSSDGSTLALFENDVIHIVNVSSGDILYYLSMNTENITTFLTNYTLYIAKDNKVFHLKHKKPGQSLMELYEDDSQIHILSISPDDRYLVYQKKNNHEVIIFDFKENKHFIKELGFMVQRVIFPLSGDSFYVILLNDSGKDRIPVRELYLYNFKKESIFAISALTNTDIKLYLRKND
jgi:Tol biopolymer transport system component